MKNVFLLGSPPDVFTRVFQYKSLLQSADIECFFFLLKITLRILLLSNSTIRAFLKNGDVITGRQLPMGLLCLWVSCKPRHNCFCFYLSFQGSLYSKQPWMIKTVGPLLTIKAGTGLFRTLGDKACLSQARDRPAYCLILNNSLSSSCCSIKLLGFLIHVQEPVGNRTQ